MRNPPCFKRGNNKGGGFSPSDFQKLIENFQEKKPKNFSPAAGEITRGGGFSWI